MRFPVRHAEGAAALQIEQVVLRRVEIDAQDLGRIRVEEAEGTAAARGDREHLRAQRESERGAARPSW